LFNTFIVTIETLMIVNTTAV